MKRSDTLISSYGRRWPSLDRRVALFLLSFVVATRAFGVQASDDHFLVHILDSGVTVTHDDLLGNDQDAENGSISEEIGPRHGTATWSEEGNTVTYFPDETFWAVGGDSLTYRVETSQGSATATVYWVAERLRETAVTMLDFESGNSLLAGQHAGLSVLQGPDAILGNGSLKVDVTPQDSSVFGTVDIPFPEGGSSNGGGSVTICVVNDGVGGTPPYTELPGDQGYLVLLGQETDTTPDEAALRVGVAESGDFFLEVKEVDVLGHTSWHRSVDLSRNHDTSRLRVTYQYGDNLLAAILRTEGLNVRIDAVPFYAPGPTHAHLGYFQPPGGGGDTSFLVDRIRIASTVSDKWLPGLLDPLQMADGFEDGTTNAWTATYGSGLILDLASSFTGEIGLGVSGLSGGPSFVSFKSPLVDELLDELSAELTVDLSSFSINPTRQLVLAAILPNSDPLFGDSDYQLRVKEYAGSLNVRAFFRVGSQTWLPETTGAWWPVTGRSVLRLQVGKGDGDGTLNGWLRLWFNGQIVQELFHLDNYDRSLRTVHFGAKGFDSQVVSGTLRFDDLNVTR